MIYYRKCKDTLFSDIKKSYICSSYFKENYMVKNKAKTLLILLLMAGMFVSAQVDTAFWFAVPHITHDHAGRPIKLCVTTLDQQATITVTMPASNNQQVCTFTVPANSSQNYQLVGGSQSDLSNIAQFECPQNATSNFGLYIHSTAKVNAYIAVQNNNSEIYALKGSNALGTQFFIPMQFQFPNANAYSDARNSVEVIATENNTSVTITPSVALYGGGHAANVPFTVILNKGQVYSFASNSQQGANHLCGTVITSTKPIVVDVSDDSATPNGSNQDLVADQIVPEELAGTQYIVVPSPPAANNTNGSQGLSDYAFIFALEDGTDAHVYSYNATGTLVPTDFLGLNRGDKRSYHFTNNNPIFIYSDKPIFVFQAIGAGNELGGTLLPHIYCTGSDQASYMPLAHPQGSSHVKHIYLTLLCKAQFIDGFQINGQTSYLNANDWHDIPGTILYKYCRKEITSLNTASSIRIKNTLGQFHLGVIDFHQTTSGYDDCSISYFSDYSTSSSLFWDRSFMESDYCQGDTIFFAFDTVDVNRLQVYAPGGVHIENDPEFLADVLPENSGYYTVLGLDSRNCLVGAFEDSIWIDIHPSLEATVRDTVCPGAGYDGYGFHITPDMTVTPGLVVDSMHLQGTEFGCDSLVTLEITVRDSVFGEFDMHSCREYTWNGHTYVESGDYQQTLTDGHGCDSLVTMHLEIVEPEVSITTSEDDFCEFGEIVLTAVSDFDQFEWNTGETTPYISVTEPGLYTVTASQGDCQASDHLTVPSCEFNLFIPNTITPSRSDGLNDYLYIPSYVHRFISDFDIEIFDRWGELIYKTNDINFRWAGEKAKVSEVYVWVIKVKNLDGKPFTYKGTITVL